MLLAVPGLVLTAAALASRQYRTMSRHYRDGSGEPEGADDQVGAAEPGPFVGQPEPALASV